MVQDVPLGISQIHVSRFHWVNVTMVKAYVQVLPYPYTPASRDFQLWLPDYRHLAPLHPIGAKPLAWGVCFHALYRAGRTCLLIPGDSPTSTSSYHLREIKVRTPPKRGYLSDVLPY